MREIDDAAGRDHALVFTARGDDRRIEGCDFIHVGDDGRIGELTVTVRPLPGAQALAAATGAQFERIAGEARAQEDPA